MSTNNFTELAPTGAGSSRFQLASVRNWKSEIIVDDEIFSHKKFLSILPESARGTDHYLITDSTVYELYGDLVMNSFKAAGFKIHCLVIPPNELSKSMVRYVELLDEILKTGLTKKSYIISMGGGVVNNIAGFLASTIYRGLKLVHIATTSLAQVDAAIDFKQAINAKYGKNLVGSMYPAEKVLIDPSALVSLPDRDFYNGLSESLKHALVQSPEFFKFLMLKSNSVREVKTLKHIVETTIQLKIEIMNDDDPILLEEMMKQYGHSVGHAVEHLSRGKILHGEAIAIGMCVSAEIATILGLASEAMVHQHLELFRAYRLPVMIPAHISTADICETIKYDKHFVDGKACMLLVNAIGKPIQTVQEGYCSVDWPALRDGIEMNRTRS